MTAGRAKITVVRPKPKPASVETVKVQKASVKKLPVKTAPKTGLENRGARLTDLQKKNRAADLQWDKVERNMEQRFDTAAGGPRAGGKTNGQPGVKNIRKNVAIDKEAAKKVPIKINSAKLKPNRIIKKSK